MFFEISPQYHIASMFGKDILGIVKFLDTRRRLPLLTFCHEITIPLPFDTVLCCLLFPLLLASINCGGSNVGDIVDSLAAV